MSVIRVEHTECLKGEIDIQGSKNAVLPMLAASILNKGHTVIYGCPDIADVWSTIDILKYVGCNVKWKNGKVEIDATKVDRYDVPECYSCKLRSSIVFLGALFARMSQGEVAYPGGCSIGDRPLDLHMDSLAKMNIQLKEKDGNICGSTRGIVGNDIKLRFPSVGATQNVILCAVLAKGTTTIENYAKEPEIYELCRFLNGMGANITVEKSKLSIVGVKELHDSEYRVCGDRIVAGTYLYMTAMTGGEITVNNIEAWHLTGVMEKLQESGAEVCIGNEYIKLKRNREGKLRSNTLIETEPFPKFPTDLQAFATVLMSVSDGIAVIKENIFENRFHTAGELVKMGAKINFESNNQIIIRGVNKLYGRKVAASDLRDGAALIMAGLFAEGETMVANTHFVSRGYEDIVRDLLILGAEVGYNREI